MKKLINIFHFVAMSSIYATAAVLFIIFLIRLTITLFTGNVFDAEDWLFFLITAIITVNTFFIVRRRSVMDLFGFPFDEKSL